MIPLFIQLKIIRAISLIWLHKGRGKCQHYNCSISKIREVSPMATRSSVEDYIQRAENVIGNAETQLTEAKKQEHYNELEYSNAQLELEKMYQDLNMLMASSNSQQKDQVYRTLLQVQQMQQHMILNDF
jgi:hypothetical protein